MTTSGHFRRFSVALGFSKSLQTAPSPSDATLARFLTDAKTAYLKDVREAPEKGSKWTVVMGNEAGDLDSFASSIALAWIQSEVHKKPTVPLIQVAREDFSLRAENIYALQLAGIQDPQEQLLSLSDLTEFKPFPSHTFALVDHNRLGSRFTTNNPNAEVVAVVDHHEDEGLYNDSADPRIITPSGSCASHVAALCPPEVPPELATLLLSAVLIDTDGLKPGGKALDQDRAAALFLGPKSTLAPSIPSTSTLTDSPNPNSLYEVQAIKELTKELSTRKTDISHMSGWDLLRRDYKEYTHKLHWAPGQPSIKTGLCTVPVQLKTWGSKGRLETDSIAWMKNRGLNLLGVLTTFRDDKKIGMKGRGKHKREMAWIVLDETQLPQEQESKDPAASATTTVDTQELASRLWSGFEGNLELRAKVHKKFNLEKGGKLPPNAKAKVYKQKNATATRKTLAPVLKDILEGPSDSLPVAQGPANL